ncbi:MAG TPA: tRNA (adenosine(37)-N6)-threonylcarbamoyltransferase complex ATPase subunit type 1 TsaE [Burkholderiales bacterium]|nr:tRNA (adenosine(37)-N6)-threonylcarbamoyltransferase complex ATPase subunit type 1 TsaE [Burkholderiales bacterium]
MRFLPTDTDTLALGAALAGALEPGTVIYLSGDLGAGKTTLARGLIRGLGYTGKVRSPTYTLVELYRFSKLYLYHFDFYRFGDPREWADAGFREYVRPDSICIVEWPENAAGRLPEADVRIALTVEGDGRRAEINANTEAGRRCIARLGG